MSVCPLCQKRYKLLWYLYICWRKNKDQKSVNLLFYVMTWHSTISKNHKYNLLNWNLWSKYKCLYASRWIKYAAFIVKTDCIKNLVAFRKKIYKNKTMVHMHLQMSLIFSCKTKVQITIEVKNLAYSSNVTKTNLWWFVECKISSILFLQNYLLYVYCHVLFGYEVFGL